MCLSRTRTSDSLSSGDSDQRRLSCPANVQDGIHERETRSNTVPFMDTLEPPYFSARYRKKKRQHKRILKFKEEVEKVYHKFKDAGTHIKDGYETFKARLSPSHDFEREFCNGRRNIHIENDDFPNSKRKYRSRELLEDDDFTFDSPDHNYSPSLTIHPLREGKFYADISLDNFPEEDDIIVRVRNYRLEILLQKKHFGKKLHHHTISKPFRCGEIDLPIYVDSKSLQFTIEDDSILTIEARCKGFLTRRLSISSDDLVVQKTKKGPKQIRDPIVKRKESKSSTTSATKWYVTDHEAKPQRPHVGAHRCRSNTR